MHIMFAAAAATAFNLVCTGETTGPAPRPFTDVIGVDLLSQRYCIDDCVRTLEIARITETEIIFADAPPGPFRVRRKVSRETGSYLMSFDIEPFSYETKMGHCEVAPFTGFPARKF